MTKFDICGLATHKRPLDVTVSDALMSENWKLLHNLKHHRDMKTPVRKMLFGRFQTGIPVCRVGEPKKARTGATPRPFQPTMSYLMVA